MDAVSLQTHQAHDELEVVLYAVLDLLEDRHLLAKRLLRLMAGEFPLRDITHHLGEANQLIRFAPESCQASAREKPTAVLSQVHAFVFGASLANGRFNLALHFTSLPILGSEEQLGPFADNLL